MLKNLLNKLPKKQKEERKPWTKMLDWHQLRAGETPGWNKPKNNGDPDDPRNMARRDVDVMVPDGSIMSNILAKHTKDTVKIRHMVSMALALPVLAGVGYFAAGQAGFIKPSQPAAEASNQASRYTPQKRAPAVVTDQSALIGNSTSDGPLTMPVAEVDEPEDAKANIIPAYRTVIEALDATYGTPNGIAKTYNLALLGKALNWPVKSYPQFSFPGWKWKSYNERYLSGSYKSISASLPEKCEGECLSNLTEETRFVALADAGQDMSLYNEGGVFEADTKNPVPRLEEILSTFKTQYSPKAATYCENENRKYAETWNNTQAFLNLLGIQQAWEGSGNFGDNKSVVKVKTFKELVEHRIADDKSCKNLNIAVLPIESGAVQYLMSVAVRTHTKAGDNIGTGLYMLGDLGSKRVMSLVACNNCGTVPIFDARVAKDNASAIIPGLNISSVKIAKLLKDSGYVIEPKKEEQATTEKGA